MKKQILSLLICCLCLLSANAKSNEKSTRSPENLSKGRIIKVQCRVFGFVKQTQSYQPIVEGSLEINPNLWANALHSENPLKTAVREKINAFIQSKPDWTDLEKQRFKQEVLIPTEIKSELFGLPGGIRLEIFAGRKMNWEGNLGPPFIVQKVIVNGIPALAEVKEDSYQLMFNEPRSGYDYSLNVLFNQKGEQITPEAQKPIITPEGQFNHILSECKSLSLSST